MISNRSKAGRITVVFAFLMVGLAAFLGVSLNISQVFQERAHLQVCADAAAFSGAVQQARGLNRIARMNTEAVKVLKTTSTGLKCFIYPNHDAGQRMAWAAEYGYRAYNGINLVRQQKVSLNAVDEARRTAEEVTHRNEPSANVSAYLPPLSFGLGRLIPAKGTSCKFGFFFKQDTPLGPIVLYDPGRKVDAFITKKAVNRDTIYFTAQVKRPSFSLPFVWGKSGSAVRNLRAYATAKPAGGTLWADEKADPRYKVKMALTGSVFPQPILPDAWGYTW